VREPIPDDPDTGGVDEANDLDLGDRVAERWRCRDSGCVEAVATPAISHGTEVASVIAATDDDDGTTGVAPRRPSSPTGSTPPAAASPSRTCGAPFSRSPPTPRSTWST
jgi:hypothetical protein